MCCGSTAQCARHTCQICSIGEARRSWPFQSTVITVMAADLPVVAVAWASSIGIFTRHHRRHTCRLNRRHNRRHCSLANNKISDNINDNRPTDRLPPGRHLPANSRVPLTILEVVAVAKGTGCNGLCVSLEWSCPHPTRLRRPAGATATRRFGGKISSYPPGISRL